MNHDDCPLRALRSTPSPRTRTVLAFLRLGALALAAATLFEMPASAQPPAAETKRKAATSPPAVLQQGDDGPWVESLQRRLNARLEPSPALDVDGDFGAATRAALVRFQTARGLKASGTADPKTWEALGPDPGSGPDPLSPAVVNAERPTKRPADAIEGAPFVTAKAWAVVDARTGKLLAGHAESQPLEMASTTKIMTALLVVRSAREVPRIYDETVTFSERADHTPGSTSGVHAGEMLPVRELLYGLLLPSGNDAAVAFAEHFGGRFSTGDIGPDAEQSPKRRDPLDGFVAEMNRVASELGLNETRFVNPHGLPAREHHSSARDLARLAMEALKDPVFAATVVTPRRGCTLVDAQGKTRNVVWTNTNRLLDTEGYDGVKTGTTTAAGNCLVASSRRGADRLIVVLLGSSASDGRYADARNLFRWGWQRLGHRESGAAAPLRAK